MQRVTPLKTDRHDQTPHALLECWHRFLQEHDRSPGTIKKYTQAVVHFLSWYEQEERVPLQLAALTPIALIGYRNFMQLHATSCNMSNTSPSAPSTCASVRCVPGVPGVPD